MRVLTFCCCAVGCVGGSVGIFCAAGAGTANAGAVAWGCGDIGLEDLAGSQPDSRRDSGSDSARHGARASAAEPCKRHLKELQRTRDTPVPVKEETLSDEKLWPGAISHWAHGMPSLL